MRGTCYQNRECSRRFSRRGLIHLGALREILVIGVSVALVITTLWQANSVIELHSSASKQPPSDCRDHPVLGVFHDRDHGSLVVHLWPAEFENIAMATGVSSKLLAPESIAEAAASETNSTTVMLTSFHDTVKVRHGVSIIRNGEILFANEALFKDDDSGGVHISSNGTVAIAIGDQGDFFGWDLSTNDPIPWQYPLNKSVSTSLLSPDGQRFFLATDDGQSSIRDVRTGGILTSLPPIGDCHRKLTWSADGRTIAMGNPIGELFVFDTSSGARLWRHQLETPAATALGLSADGRLLAVGTFCKQLQVWDLSKPTNPTKLLTRVSGIPNTVLFSESDTKLIVGCYDGTICEWSLETGQMTHQFR